MLAIPVFRSRVAPVLNWCSRVFIVPTDTDSEMSGHEIILDDINGFERLRTLREKGVDTLICGALSPDLLSYGKSLGMQILPGIAGFIDEVLVAFRERKLDQPYFRLPGCARRRGYRSGRKCCESTPTAPLINDTKRRTPKSKHMERGGHAKGCPFENRGTRPSDGCHCPWCGTELPERE